MTKKSLRKRKNAFTLIELLAVIVILAIIALIATPIVLQMITNTKDSSLIRSADFYLDGVEQAVMKKKMKDSEFNPILCEIKDQELYCDEEKLEIEVDGEKPSSGSIGFENGNIKSVTLKYSNDKTIVKNEEGSLVYQTIPTPKSFAEDDWSTIVANINSDVYNVGDTKEIALTGFTNKETGSNGLYTIRIANKSTPEECNTEGFSQSACGFVIEFEDIITTHNMNPKGKYKGTQYNYGWNVDGYPASEMYTYIQNDIYNALPEDLRNVIIPTTVVSSHGSTEGEANFVSKDNVYLLSTKEVWGKEDTTKTINNDTAEAVTRQLDYYSNLGVTTANYSGTIKKLDGTANCWWLRSAASNLIYYFYRVANYGGWDYIFATDTHGVAVAFRIG